MSYIIIHAEGTPCFMIRTRETCFADYIFSDYIFSLPGWVSSLVAHLAVRPPLKTAGGPPDRSEIDAKYQWNLADMYSF